jgi:DNA polymerase I-like protein with 3'-5' exonuclease and polymerase domains
MIIVPTISPAYLLRSGDAQSGQARFEQTVVADVIKARRLLDSGSTWDESSLHARDAGGRLITCFPTLSEVYAFVRACLIYGDTIAIDIETTGKTTIAATLVCVGFACRLLDGQTIALCVPFFCQGGSQYWHAHETRDVWHLLDQLFSSRLRKVFQNGGFDTTVLQSATYNWRVENWTADTMAAHHVIDSELPHGLDYIGTRHLDVRYWKGETKGELGFLELPDEVLRIYNLRDALVTLRLQPILEAEVQEQSSWGLYQEEIALAKLMSRATTRGMLIDENRRNAYQAALTLQRDAAIMQFRELVPTVDGKPLDLNKPKHIFEALFLKLGLPIVKRTESGAASTDKDALVSMALLSESKAQRTGLQALADFRTSAKTLSTVIKGMPLVRDRYGGLRIHPSWKCLANTGRFTSSPNAQNWNKATKKMFCAAPGYEYVGVDLSQAELRGVAYFSNDKPILKMFEDKINIHTVNCSLLFKVRCRIDHKDLGAQTAAYIHETIPDYDSYPELEDSRWAPTRTLAKNFEFGCVASNTEVALLNGTKRIDQIQPGDMTWCWDGEKYAATRIVRAWSSGVKPCLKITLSYGHNRELIVTPGHKMLMRDGRYVEAGNLRIRDELMPFNRTLENNQGYRKITPKNDGHWLQEHRWVALGDVPLADEKPLLHFVVAHHRDHDAGNNLPDNLDVVLRSEHTRLHMLGPRPPDWGRNSAAIREKNSLSAWQTKSKPRNTGRNSLSPQIAAIEWIGKHNVWDLEVEHPAHNFAINGAVFVSNSNYRAEADTLHRVLRSKRDPDTNKPLFPSLDLALVEGLLAKKKQIRPALVSWWHRHHAEIQKRGYAICPISGRRRWFRGGFKVTETANWNIQTLIASHVNRATLRIQAKYDEETGGEALIIQQVHDALNSEVPAGYGVRGGEIMREELDLPFDMPGIGAVRLPADAAQVGQYLNEV